MPELLKVDRRLLRRVPAAIAAMALIAGTLGALATPAFAGNNMNVVVNLVIVGAAPAGTTFTVHFACAPGAVTGDLTFDAAGNPLPPTSNFFNDGVINSTCTITETGTGGASSVAFQCADDGVNASCSSPTGNQVTFDSPTSTSTGVVFTITNTFVAAPEAVAIAPSFTG